MLLHRRDIVLGGLLSISFVAGFPQLCLRAATASRARGCVLTGADARAVYDRSTGVGYVGPGQTYIPRSGDRDFDLALAITLAQLSDMFEVLPGFAYFDDRRAPNAYALAEIRLKNADGTVLFGQTLLAQLLRNPEHPDLAIAAICAHEWGHIVQFKRDLISRLDAGQRTVKRTELHADFLSGYYAGRKKRQRSDYPAAVYAVTAQGLGDHAVNNPQHHGTPDERASAIVNGFKAAYELRLSLNEAVAAGTNYVLSI